MASSISTPIVILFERHWDETPGQLLKDLLPKLAEEGYDTWGLEAPHDISAAEIMLRSKKEVSFRTGLYSQAIQCLKQNHINPSKKLSDIGFDELSKLMRQHVSSKRFSEVAEKIKHLPALLLFKENLDLANRLFITLKGVDMESSIFDPMIDSDITTKMRIVNKNEGYRIKTITDNLLKLHTEGKGVVFTCGVLHADNVIAKFKEKNMDHHVIYYFTRSAKKFFDKLDDVEMFLSNKTTENHTHFLNTATEIKLFANGILREIRSRNTQYLGEVAGGNSQSALLNRVFDAEFKLFRRPRHYVDVLLNVDQTPHVEKIKERLQAVRVHIHQIDYQGQKYLVIADVNTKDVADKLMLL